MASVIHPVLTHDYLLTAIAETRKQLDTTPELERQIKAFRRKLEELVIAIQRTLNTIEKTESSAAQERLKQREADKAGAQANLQNSGLAWKDHEFSTGVLDKGPIRWDLFSLQFDNGPVLILFQLRESGGGTSDSLSGTFINAEGVTQSLQNENFRITVLDQWRSPHTGGIYPAAWKIQLEDRTAN